MPEAAQIEAAIQALEAQRATLGDAVIETALAPLREQLAALRAPQMRLRQITVLFADIVDSTALGGRLDAEDLVAIVSGALQRFAQVVESSRGRIARFTGDGLKAIFGADGDEDAAECAVRAALAIVAAAESIGAELQHSHGLAHFAVRVGIHTGTAALGGGIEADHTAMGDTVNLAARLQQAAPVGGVLVSRATHAQVRGLFDVTEVGPLALKGYAAPVPAYRVQRARPRDFRAANRGIAGVETPLVGRAAELEQLLGAFDRVRATHWLHAVSVIGEAGVGKSRLLRELLQRLPARERSAVVLLARAGPQMRLQPYALLRELVAAHCAIAETDSAELARSKLCEALAPLIGRDDAEVLGQLIGLDFSARAPVRELLNDARLLRHRAFRAVRRWLAALAQQRAAPVALLLDDLQWADQGSLAWLHELPHGARELPLLVLMLARPALLDAHPHWGRDDPCHARIDLAPLDAAASDALAGELLRRLDQVPAELSRLLTRGAEGNPFYMEELVQMLIDDGVIVVGDGAPSRWRLASARLSAARVPATLAGVLQARIDALAPSDRAALQHAAVVGPVFWDGALEALQPGAADSLPLLLARRLVVRREPGSFADCSEFAFAHHLLHQATYDTVLKSVRRAGHARAALWLAEHLHERAGEHLAACAEHFERAGSRAQAAVYFARAARHAAERYVNDAALEHGERALANLDADAVDARYDMLQLRERVLDVIGDRAAQRAALDAMAALCAADAAPSRRAEVAFRRALLADRGGEFAAAIGHAAEAAALAESAGLARAAAQAYGEWAFALTRGAQREAARAKADTALAHARASGDPLVEAQILAVAAHVADTLGEPPRAIELLRQAIELARAHGHVRLEGLLHGNLGGVLISIGELGQARVHEEASLRIAREIGNRSAEANALGSLAGLLLELGEVAPAIDTAQQAVTLAAAVGDRWYRALWLLALGDALAAAGRGEDAAAAYREAGDLREAAAVAAARLDANARLAELALARGAIDEARALLAPVLAADDALLAQAEQPLRVRLAAYRVLAAAADPRARGWLQAAFRELQAQAARLPDAAARERFVSALAHHRAIAAAHAALARQAT